MCRAVFKKFLITISKRKQFCRKKTILEKEKIRRTYNMANEEIKKEVVEEQPKQEEVVEKKEEVLTEKEEQPKVEETKTEEKEVPAKEEEQPCDDGQPKVEEIEDTAPNAIRVEDLVTKADLQELLNAFNAKLDAVIKENQDLKDANSQLKDKYETGDFGSEVKNGTMQVQAPKSYQTFDDYAKQFM